MAINESPREKVIRLIREMRNRTTDRGATPAEAAAFAAKVAEWIERYQVDEAELRAKEGATNGSVTDIDVCQNTLRTGAKVFNPGMNQIVYQLATAMCCRVILLTEYRDGEREAVYGIVGDVLDADYVCQMSVTLVPMLRMMARLEGAEHGHEKGSLVKWTNQYLTGAAYEVRCRIEQERKDRSEVKQAAAQLADSSCTALAVITGESIAIAKRAATEEAFTAAYPKTTTHKSRTDYDPTAQARGREAGKQVSLNLQIE